jgi:hypothetical protein
MDGSVRHGAIRDVALARTGPLVIISGAEAKSNTVSDLSE